MKEIWKPVVGYEQYYLVSNLGRVKSKPRKVHFGKQSRSVGNNILKFNDNGHGYMQVTLSVNNHHKNLYVHRMVAEAFIPNPLKVEQINHIDANKWNNKVSNLEWVTSKENIDHAIKNGLTPMGSHSVRAKLTRLQARSIKREYLIGIPSDIISKHYGCPVGTVNSIGNGTVYGSDTQDIPVITNHHRKILKTKYELGNKGISPRGNRWRAVLTIDGHEYLDSDFATKKLAVDAQKRAFNKYLMDKDNEEYSEAK
ncbi:NUMOD4 domain-containing protein [Secundilactobacillus yichangensis]|uniref:NUMOD4 domain-containing protein n=1 Tax=Secundilactobacillus yichangensis TaxID=2799580 RepID=UPI001F43F871|nr:NUMOD4 domain-containing protein [Secundilactobacillus yichangensis]